MKTTLAQRPAAEALGTALFVATVVGSGVMSEMLAKDVGLELLGPEGHAVRRYAASTRPKTRRLHALATACDEFFLEISFHPAYVTECDTTTDQPLSCETWPNWQSRAQVLPRWSRALPK